MRKAIQTCTFCDIIHGAGEVSLCYEDADALAFMDIQPVNPGHVLVVPRTHYKGLAEVPRQMAMHLFDIAMRIADVVRQVTGSGDLNIVVNSGESAGQDVLHYHVHVIPRRPDDGFDVPLPFAGSEMPDRTLLDAMAARLIAALRDPMRSGGVGVPRAPSRVGMSAENGASAGPEREPPVERAARIASFREYSVADRPPPPRDDVVDERPRANWSVHREGAHGELRPER